MTYIIAYLILCLIVGLFARKRALGIWGFFGLSIIFSPLITAIVLALTTPKKAVESKRART